MQQGVAVRNNRNTAENRRLSAKKILRVFYLRSTSQVLNSLPACLIKLRVDYSQDCAQNSIGFWDGI